MQTVDPRVYGTLRTPALPLWLCASTLDAFGLAYVFQSCISGMETERGIGWLSAAPSFGVGTRDIDRRLLTMGTILGLAGGGSRLP